MFFKKYFFLLVTLFLFKNTTLFSQDTYLDTFGNAAYNNSNGTQTWSTSWVEDGETTNATNGRIRVNSNQLRFRNLDGRSISRIVDLSSYVGQAVLLTLNYDRTNGDETINIDILNSSNVWETVANADGTGSIRYRLSANQIHAGTAIRLITGSGNWGNNETVFIDDIQFEAVYTIADGVSESTCSGLFTDSGGTTLAYENFEDSTYTICPDIPGGEVRVTFNSFDVEDNFDFLRIYDGTTTADPLLGTFDNGNSPTGTTISSTTGCLTFRFTSDFSVTGTGWDATISCVVPGPEVEIENLIVNENIGFATVVARLTGGTVPGGFSVNYTTVDNTALANSDYFTSIGSLNFIGSNNETQTINIPIINNIFGENDETFFVNLSGISNPSVGTQNGVVTIQDDGDAAIDDDVPLTLFDEFNGLYDYAVTAGTFRTADEDVDACAITTTSSNTLTTSITPGSTIQKAYLIWGHSHISADDVVTFEGQNVTADVVNTAFGFYYGMVSDVTSIVQAIPDPSTNVYDVSGLTIDNGLNGDPFGYCSGTVVFGGWSLFIFYTNPAFPAVSINMYNGFDGSSSETSSYTLSGFYAIGSTGSKTSILSWEGDRLRTGNEVISVTTGTGTTDLSGDGDNNPPTLNNVFNATIYDNTAIPIINDTSLYGFDLDTYDISSLITQGETTVTTNVETGGDFVLLNSVLLKVPSNLMTGYVFEDTNYPGGAGRNRATASGIGVENARVELYDNTNTLIDSDFTDATGEYFLGGMSNGDYSLRVVNSTVRSSRGGGGSCGNCLPVQTYRANYTASTLTPITNEVGGADPSAVDVAASVFVGAQTISSVSVLNEGVADLDFGFNFSTIVNTNGDDQGSLGQFILNSNALDEATLDIEANSIFDPAAGDDVSIFMIPSATDPLGRTADTNFASGFFDIAIPNGTPLPAITDDETHIDGRTQTAYSGDTNSGTVGSGGTAVGISATALPNYDLPEIQVHSDLGDVIQIQASNTTIRNIAVYAGNLSAIRHDSGTGNLVSASLLGTNALGLLGTVGVGTYSNQGIETGGGSVTVDGNYIALNTDFGISVDGGTATTIQNNHITNNGFRNCEYNISVTNGSTVLIQNNLITNSAAAGIFDNQGSISISENTITTSGSDNGCALTSGVNLNSSSSSVSSNLIHTNGGSGVVLTGGSTSGNLISQNSIYANGTISPALGIDLNNDGVSLNDNGDGDSGPNGLLNFPAIETATISGNSLIVRGWSRPGATIEFFVTDIAEGSAAAGDNQLGLSQDYGEGQTFIASLVEGSGSDSDTTSSTYTDADGNTDTTNRFDFSINLSAILPIGTAITATATISNTTSEFGGKSILTLTTIITNRKITYRVNPN